VHGDDRRFEAEHNLAVLSGGQNKVEHSRLVADVGGAQGVLPLRNRENGKVAAVVRHRPQHRSGNLEVGAGQGLAGGRVQDLPDDTPVGGRLQRGDKKQQEGENPVHRPLRGTIAQSQ